MTDFILYKADINLYKTDFKLYISNFILYMTYFILYISDFMLYKPDFILYFGECGFFLTYFFNGFGMQGDTMRHYRYNTNQIWK